MAEFDSAAPASAGESRQTPSKPSWRRPFARFHHWIRDAPPGSWDGDETTRRPEARLPPQLPRWKCMLLWFADGAFVIAIGFILLSCVTHAFNWSWLSPGQCWLYIAIMVAILGLSTDRFLRYPRQVHNGRLEDRGEVEKVLDELFNVRPRLDTPDQLTPFDFEDRKKAILQEVNAFKEKDPMTWVDYKVLYFRQLLVDFLKIEELISKSRSILSNLEDYAEDTAFRYDKKIFHDWDKRIEIAIDRIEESDITKLVKDEAAERLRAELKGLLEHFTDYESSWAAGTALMRNLTIVGSFSLLLLVFSGFIPLLFPDICQSTSFNFGQMGIFSWGFLGASGALAAVLLSFRKADVVEVGNTEGRKEVWRAISGAVLGFLAGILIYSIIVAGIFPKDLVPDPQISDPKNVGLAILWSFFSGFFMERVFERLWNPLQMQG